MKSFRQFIAEAGFDPNEPRDKDGKWTGSKLYHLSSEETLNKIRQSGFKPSDDSAVYGPGVYLTTDPEFRNLPHVEAEVDGPHKVIERPDGSKWVIVPNPKHVRVSKK